MTVTRRSQAFENDRKKLKKERNKTGWKSWDVTLKGTREKQSESL